AEPYGGAITRGLEKDDYSELEHLREQDNRYRLRITNEVDEQQYTNLMELWVLDHDPGTRVLADQDGHLHTVGNVRQLLKASDSAGADLAPWLRATDRLIWEPEAVPDAQGNLRREITMEFPKPAGATSAKLVVNAATGLWGSYMIKKMVELRGRAARDWFWKIDHDPGEVRSLFAWDLREELFALKIYVQEPTGWEVRGVLQGMGPFISKDRVVPLDITRVRSDRLRIRIRPPAGFWALNSFAVDYTRDAAVNLTRVPPASARDNQGRAVLAQLRAVDDQYYVMPTTADWADVDFVVPARRAGRQRTIFLHSRGYYTLHLQNGGEPDTHAIAQIQNVPETPAHFAAAAYAEWRAERNGTP
ncbi:MAG: hypothetical protein JOZ62_14955, partial [Acidobacteriaceae bacterium]|nr:hypothetical protein [Acidobacteriaceae bacterium]